MNGGRVFADGAAAAVLTRERIAQVYGVDAWVDAWVGEAGGAPVILPLNALSRERAGG